MPRAAQVGGDAVNDMIRSGFVWFMGKPSNEALRQDELCNRNMCALANNFSDFASRCSWTPCSRTAASWTSSSR